MLSEERQLGIADQSMSPLSSDCNEERNDQCECSALYNRPHDTKQREQRNIVNLLDESGHVLIS
jgi:hypothetical protein